MLLDYFFFQAEDGIRAGRVTGVQTCALPISFDGRLADLVLLALVHDYRHVQALHVLCRRGLHLGKARLQIPAILVQRPDQIGRASCRERRSTGSRAVVVLNTPGAMATLSLSV